MKFLAVFALLVAVVSANNTWNLHQLSQAIEDPHTDPTLLPYLEKALNEMMTEIFAGNPVRPVVVTIGVESSPVESTWTLHELSEALQDPNTDPALIPAMEAALDQMMDDLISGNPVVPVAIVGASVSAPTIEIHHYTFQEVQSLLQDPTTHPVLLQYLENALDTMVEALYSGVQMESIVIAVPAGLKPIEVAVPVPELPTEVIPAPVDIVVPAPTSPLVQIILNINQQ